jgi:hypothetical protein
LLAISVVIQNLAENWESLVQEEVIELFEVLEDLEN